MNVATVLAVDPTAKGLCFAVLAGSERLVSWGCVECTPGAGTTRARVASLCERFVPTVLVVEDVARSRRGERARRRVQSAIFAAVDYDMAVRSVNRAAVREHFRETGTKKYTIALAISRQFPELAHKLPPRRRPWMSEPERMNIFDAVSFALTALHTLERE